LGAAGAWVKRQDYGTRGGSLVPLPGTERETSLVVAAFGGDGVVVLCGADATESAVREAMANKQIVHLATHGLVSLRRNDLLAALAFTPERGGSPGTRDDGFLQLFEIYDLTLSADLVVLSACESSYGKYVRGEGVMALTRGFQAAGASRVIASLWKVDDKATAELMGDFFGRIAASRRAGDDVDYARSLRDAKRAIRGRSSRSHPFYWSAFVVTGVR
jgi:CHAT domain-containing protein